MSGAAPKKAPVLWFVFGGIAFWMMVAVVVAGVYQHRKDEDAAAAVRAAEAAIPQSDRYAESEIAKLDYVAANGVPDMTLERTWLITRPDQPLKAVYSWTPPGSIRVAAALKMDPDVVLKCARQETELRSDPAYCFGAGATKVDFNGWPICFYREDRPIRGVARGQGAMVAWNSYVDCHVEFRHGLMRGTAGRESAIQHAMVIAKWIEDIHDRKIDANTISLNRAVIRAAIP